MLLKGFNKISVRIPLRVTWITLVMLGIICTIANLTIVRITQNNTVEKLEYVAQANARRASEYLETMYAQASMLGLVFSNVEDMEQAEAKDFISDILTGLLNDPRVYSTYVAFEPNAVFADTPNGSSFYVFRHQDGIQLDTTEGYDVYSTEDYYAVSMETGQPYITEPYEASSSVADMKRWLVTISVPVFNQSGQLVGVANSDIVMNAFGSLDYDVGGFSQAYQYITTDAGVYLAHTADRDKVGSSHVAETGLQPIDFGLLSNQAENLQQGHESIYDIEACIMRLPINITGVNQQWYSTFVVSKAEVRKEAMAAVVMMIGVSVLCLAVLAALVAVSLRRALKPIEPLVAFAHNMNQGQLSQRITVNSKNELGELADTFNSTSQTLHNYVSEISEVLQQVAGGNLLVDVQQDYRGDFAPIKDALSAIIQDLSTTFAQIHMAAEQVSAGADQTAGGAQALAQGAAEQAGSIQQLSAEISEVTEQIGANAQSAALAREATAGVGAAIDQSNHHMKEVLESMESINRSSQQISKIIRVIHDIAYQTHLLSLNASVEAARAGAAGKGFLVVADEVRNLASKTAAAAEQTQTIIEGSAALARQGGQLTAEMADSLEQINNSFEQMTGLITRISEASGQQAVSIGQINQGIELVASVVQTNSATAEESSATSEELASQADMLKQQISRFEYRQQEEQEAELAFS